MSKCIVRDNISQNSVVMISYKIESGRKRNRTVFMEKEKKKIISDLLYCIGATGLMNLILQFVVYPMVNYQIGENGFGDMLFWIGVVSILAPSFGLAVNNTRLVFPERQKTSNGDYISVLLIFTGAAAVVILVLCYIQKCKIAGSIVLVYIVLISIFRNYSTVEYRLNLNYKQQLLFYVILSAGYVTGALLCKFTGLWTGVFLTGETLAVLYVVCRGNIYRRFTEKTFYRKELSRKCIILAGAYLLTNLMLNLDRLVLMYSVGNEAVSQYYVVSLLGKTVAIIGGPLSSIIISYISKDDYHFNKKEFLKIVAVMSIMGLIFLGAAALITPVYIRILYPNLYAGVKGLNVLVNAAQIFYFLTTLLLVIVLTICDARWQLKIQISYSLLFSVTAVWFTNVAGLKGFAVAAFLSNLCYFLAAAAIGIKVLSDQKEQTK